MAKSTPRKSKTTSKTAITNSGSDTIRTFRLSQADEALSFSFFDGFNRDLSDKEAYAAVVQMRAAASAIADIASKARPRIFTRDGREVTGGPLWNLVNRPNFHLSAHTLRKELISWLLIVGEYAIKVATTIGGEPVSLTPLDPNRLRYLTPVTPKHLGEVQKWQYIWHGGTTEDLNAQEVIFDRTFNPMHPVRGLPPAISGVNEMNSLYQSGRFIKQFFGNNGVPASVVTLPQGTSNQDFNRFKAEYETNFSGINGKAWKNLVTRGGTKDQPSVKIEPITQAIDFTKFTDLIQHMSQSIFTLYRVPPIVSGDWANAKYDSAAEQLQTFLDNTVCPILDGMSETFQLQLVDRFEWSEGAVFNSLPNGINSLNKILRNSFTQALDNRLASNFFILFDPSTIPMYARLQRAQIGAIEDLREKALMSVNQAAEWLGVELPDDPTGIRDQIWVKNGLMRLDVPQQEEKVTEQTPAKKEETQDTAKDGAEETTNAVANLPSVPSLTPEQKALVPKLSKVINSLRTYVIQHVESGKPLLLREMDALAGEYLPSLRVKIRQLHNQLTKQFLKAADPAGKLVAAKGVFNAVRRRDLGKLLLNEPKLGS